MTLEQIVEAYGDKGFHLAYRLTGNVEEAKELVQEAFVRLMSRWETYDQSQPVENWFLTILRNIYLDNAKRYERRHAVSLDSVASPEGDSFADLLADDNELPLLERLERQETAAFVQRAMDTLTDEHRAILTLTDMQGLRYEQAAEVMDLPLGTIRSRMSRARAALKKALLALGQEVQP